MWADEDRPKLGRGVRLRYDPVRQKQILLRPEGAIELNPSAAAVLELCDGERTVGQVIDELQAKYEAVDIAADIRELIGNLSEVGVVVHADR